MADHRMNGRAGREAEREHGRSRLPADAQGVQLRPLGLLSCISSLALLAHTPPGRERAVDIGN